MRGSSIGGFSALALLVMSLFAATWLDDSRWTLTGLWNVPVSWGLGAIAFCAAVLTSLWTMFPRKVWRADQGERIRGAAAADVAAEAAALERMLGEQQQRNDRRMNMIRAASVAMAVGVVAAAAQGLAFAVGADLVDQRQGGGQQTQGRVLVANAAQWRLARRYAPVVYLHPHEEYLPMGPGAFLAGSQLTWRLRRGHVVTVASHVSAAKLGVRCGPVQRACYAFGGYASSELTRPFSGGERAGGLPVIRGFARDVANPLRRGSGRPAPLFFEANAQPAAGELRLVYWFFYGFSVPFRALTEHGDRNVLPFSHEGDWENIVVVLVRGRPQRVVFYGHGQPHAVPWGQVDLTGPGDTHPSCSARATATPPTPTRRRRSTSTARRAGTSPDCSCAHGSSALVARGGRRGSLAAAGCATRARSRGMGLAERGARPAATVRPPDRWARHAGSYQQARHAGTSPSDDACGDALPGAREATLDGTPRPAPPGGAFCCSPPFSSSRERVSRAVVVGVLPLRFVA